MKMLINGTVHEIIPPENTAIIMTSDIGEKTKRGDFIYIPTKKVFEPIGPGYSVEAYYLVARPIDELSLVHLPKIRKLEHGDKHGFIHKGESVIVHNLYGKYFLFRGPSLGYSAMSTDPKELFQDNF